jgi:hypothetical protein
MVRDYDQDDDRVKETVNEIEQEVDLASEISENVPEEDGTRDPAAVDGDDSLVAQISDNDQQRDFDLSRESFSPEIPEEARSEPTEPQNSDIMRALGPPQNSSEVEGVADIGQNEQSDIMRAFGTSDETDQSNQGLPDRKDTTPDEAVDPLGDLQKTHEAQTEAEETKRKQVENQEIVRKEGQSVRTSVERGRQQHPEIKP